MLIRPMYYQVVFHKKTLKPYRVVNPIVQTRNRVTVQDQYGKTTRFSVDQLDDVQAGLNRILSVL